MDDEQYEEMNEHDVLSTTKIQYEEDSMLASTEISDRYILTFQERIVNEVVDI